MKKLQGVRFSGLPCYGFTQGGCDKWKAGYARFDLVCNSLAVLQDNNFEHTRVLKTFCRAGILFLPDFPCQSFQ